MRLFIFTRKTWPQHIIAPEKLINQENIFLPPGAPVRPQSQSTNRVRRFLSASKNLLVLEKVIKNDKISWNPNCLSIEGWKIMPDDGQQNIDDSALKSVVSIIKDMELKVFYFSLKTSNSYQLNIRDSLCLRESVSKFRDEIWGQFYHIYLSLNLENLF